MPELPAARLARFQTEYGLPEYDAEVLTSDKALADNFEATVKELPSALPQTGEQLDSWMIPTANVNVFRLRPRELC